MKSLQQGFSLIELLVVIAIIGVLAAVGTTGYQSYLDSAKLSANKANVQTMIAAIKNEDAAQQASAGAYTECATAANLSTCLTAILADSSLKNPYADAVYDSTTLEVVDFSDGVPDDCDGTKVALIYLDNEAAGDIEVTGYYCSDDADDDPVSVGTQSLGFFTGNS